MSARPLAPAEAVGGCWPDESQTQLLRAALLDGEEAREAYREWRRRAPDLDAVDAGSYRILPLLADTMGRLGVHDELLARAAGIRRHAWSKNQLRAHRVAPAIRALQGAGIPVLILKGTAMTALYYGSAGLRIMNDVDVLVPRPAGAAARGILEARGWLPTLHLPPSQLPLIHALGYADADGWELDLHWHALWECCRPGADDELWAHAVELRTPAFAARALGPTDQLLHVCAHGLRWSASPTIHWAADAALVVRRAGGRIDWDRLVTQAAARGLTLQLSEAFAYLLRELRVAVPGEVVEALRRVRAGRLERMELRVRMRPPSLLRGLALHWFDHRRLAAGVSLPRRLAGFPVYLRALWGVGSLWRVPLTAAGKVLGRLLRPAP